MGTRKKKKKKTCRHACTQSMFATLICEVLDCVMKMILVKILLDCFPLAAGFVNAAPRQVLASLLDVMLHRLTFASGP